MFNLFLSNTFGFVLLYLFYAFACMFLVWCVLVILRPIRFQKKSQKRRENKLKFLQKSMLFKNKLKNFKETMIFKNQKSIELIRYGLQTLLIIIILVISQTTANCQTDTLSHHQKDSLVLFLSAINKDLIDYDLLKEKSFHQGEQIKGLKAIQQQQNQVSFRKELKLDMYSNSIIKLQNENFRLQNDLTISKKKGFNRGLENWFWRGTAIFITGKILNFY
jgi:hypothetical protein